MEKVELQVSALSNSESSPGNFVLVLEEEKSQKRLPIIIGTFEAQAIALFLEKLMPPRPLTHDLFIQTLKNAGIQLLEATIYGKVNGAFAAHLVLKDKSGNQWNEDARSSDAIALAIRVAAPVFIDKTLFEQFAFKEEDRKGMLRGSLREYSMEELEILLTDFLEKEDYEGAAKIRDIVLQKRNTQ